MPRHYLVTVRTSDGRIFDLEQVAHDASDAVIQTAVELAGRQETGAEILRVVGIDMPGPVSPAIDRAISQIGKPKGSA